MESIHDGSTERPCRSTTPTMPHISVALYEHGLRNPETRIVVVRQPSNCISSRTLLSPACQIGPSTPYPPLPSSLSDRKSTRLNSSHLVISYAVFCLKK